MGVMGARLGALEDFPLHFYGQHYMGTLEVPLLALIQRLGPSAWRFSGWPIRLTEAAYFALLVVVHYKLVARFFGDRAGRWAALLLCIGPIFWMDYSSRLRHVTLMMAVGELAALVALDAIDRRDRERRVGALRWLGFGALLGLMWWHYQLSAIYLAGTMALLASRPAMMRRWASRDEGDGVDALAAACLTTMVVAAAALAGHSLGWGWSVPGGARTTIPMLLAIFAAAAGIDARRIGANASRFEPALLLSGFLLGFAPALIYMLLIDPADFWIPKTTARWAQLPWRVSNLLVLDAAAALEITRPGETIAHAHQVDARSYFNLAIHSIGFYMLARAIVAPRSSFERIGGAFFLTVFGALVGLNALIDRPTFWTAPRFLTPIFAVVSVGPALAIDRLQSALVRGGERASRFASPALGAALFAGGLALWAPRWIEAPTTPMHVASGHRRVTMEMLEALRSRGVRIVDIERSPEHVLFGYELFFASGLSIRFNRDDPLGDRLAGLLDESSFGGEPHVMAHVDRSVIPAEAEDSPATLRVGDYVVYPARFKIPPRSN